MLGKKRNNNALKANFWKIPLWCPDEVKQIAAEVRDKIRDVVGVDNFVQVYNQIRKSLKRKRESRKQAAKVLEVVNPMRHAKRKIRIAAKHRAHKRRKIMNMKMGQWGR